MKIVVTASGPDLDSPVDPRFGRCQYFIFVDPDSLQFEAIENENVMASGGAGIQSAQFVTNKGAGRDKSLGRCYGNRSGSHSDV